MAEFEIFIPYPNDKYGQGIMIEEYNDRISLVLAQRGQGDATTYKKWVYPQTKDRSPCPKAIPHKIHLGETRSEAVEMLRKIAIQLKGDSKK